jgi:integrase
LRSIMNWHAARTDDYSPPIIRGMSRDDPRSKKRARILNDDEVRALWAAAANDGPYGAIIRLALLTAQRREKIASMKWDDVTVDGTWNIPIEAREKGNAGALVLPEVAVEIIRAQKRICSNPYVFAGRGDGYFSSHTNRKRGIDKKAGLEPWVFHDLRRTARSLMSRAGVPRDVSERVMGHVLPGVEGVYDRHEYRAEKAAALNKLAGLIAMIINPPADKVVSIEGAQ